MTVYVPHAWQIVRITEQDGSQHHRVIAGWRGSYLEGPSWRINSGINSLEDFGDYIEFYGGSGSIYRCYKDSEGYYDAAMRLAESVLLNLDVSYRFVPYNQLNWLTKSPQ